MAARARGVFPAGLECIFEIVAHPGGGVGVEATHARHFVTQALFGENFGIPSSTIHVLWLWRRRWGVRPGLIGSQHASGVSAGIARIPCPLGGSYVNPNVTGAPRKLIQSSCCRFHDTSACADPTRSAIPSTSIVTAWPFPPLARTANIVAVKVRVMSSNCCSLTRTISVAGFRATARAIDYPTQVRDVDLIILYIAHLKGECRCSVPESRRHVGARHRQSECGEKFRREI